MATTADAATRPEVIGTEYPHIVRRADVLGNTPVVAGTRLPVWQIALASVQGVGVAELVDAFPNLTPAAAHSALAYYWDHRAEIEAEIEANRPENALRDIRSNPDWIEERPGTFRLGVQFGSSQR